MACVGELQMKGKRKMSAAAVILGKMSELEILRAAAAIISRKKSPAKARASRENGKLGGRPKEKDSLSARAKRLGISRQALWARENRSSS
jgi:hypothetical protein